MGQKMEKDRIQLDITWQAILKVAAVALGLWFVWIIKDIVILFFVVLVIVAAFSSIIDRWSKKMNRVLAITLLYVLLLMIGVILGLVIIPPVANQIRALAASLPTLTQKVFPFFGVWQDLVHLSAQSLGSLASQLQSLTVSVYTTTIGFFGGIVVTFTIVVLSFYLLLEEYRIRKFIKEYLPLQNREALVDITQKIGRKMGDWLRGQVCLMVIIGVVDYIGLSIIGVPFALVLALWAAITEIIPYIGPILGAIPAVIIGFTVSPLVALIVLIFYILVQQLESNFLVPKIMQKAVGLSPVIIILALLIGGKLAGVLGVILAVPVVATIGVLVQELPRLRQKDR
jgi:predicted PurR-regulated permease PerM